MLKRKKKSVEKVESQRKSTTEMHSFFLNIWNKRMHVCEISKLYLGKEANSMYFHHILSKSKYPQAKLDSENIIILHPNIHAQVEQDMYRYEEINKKRDNLKEKYGI